MFRLHRGRRPHSGLEERKGRKEERGKGGRDGNEA